VHEGRDTQRRARKKATDQHVLHGQIDFRAASGKYAFHDFDWFDVIHNFGCSFEELAMAVPDAVSVTMSAARNVHLNHESNS
jgi:hypothetical protein